MCACMVFIKPLYRGGFMKPSYRGNLWSTHTEGALQSPLGSSYTHMHISVCFHKHECVYKYIHTYTHFSLFLQIQEVFSKTPIQRWPCKLPCIGALQSPIQRGLTKPQGLHTHTLILVFFLTDMEGASQSPHT